uniref:Peroxidase n=1 Tax=Ditylenchus dipsaci TaxID=166011 RepID=A0A915EI03_9BILA
MPEEWEGTTGEWLAMPGRNGSTRPRLHGLQNSLVEAGSRLLISEQAFRIAAYEAEQEVRVLFSESDAKPIDLRHPVAASITQYNRIHPLNEKAKKLSEPAYVSIALTRRLKKMGVANFDFEFNQFDSRALDNTTIGGKKCPHETISVCPPTPYRSLSGHCNNVEHPLWGMALEGFQRLTHNAYFDGISMPRRTKGGADLPSVRQISLELFYNPFEEHQTVTEIAAYWRISCPALLFAGFAHADCDPIDVMSTDPVYSQARVTCIPHARTLPAPRPNCKLGAREQANQVSSFLDGSTIYGTSTEDLNRLRVNESAKLSTSSYAGLLDLLPLDPKTGDYCQSQHHKKKCFQSGSSDVNLLPGLSAIHTLWFRQHNHVVDKLKEINRHWSNDRLFEEARKVVIAQIQHITYSEFLPVIIGNDYMRRFGLTLKESGYDSGYDMSLDASTLNEFASLAVPIAFSLLATPTQSYEEQFNNPDRIYEKSGLENLLKDMIARLAEKPGIKMDEHFRGKFLLSKVSNVGLDIVSIALKQGRDHGLPGFFFNELEEELVIKDLADRLATIYETVDDIDLLVGVLAERPKKGSFVGPTLACIIANQFYRTRRGDRFWYENFFAPSAFTEEQLVQIRRTTLSRLICDVTNVDQIQLSSFMRPNSFDDQTINGEKLPALDLDALEKLLPEVDVSSFVANYTAFLSEDGRASVDECLPRMLPCDHTARYRTYSGWCNNLKFPSYGNAFTALRHLMPPVYDDGFDAPRIRAKSGQLLPSPRRISNAVHVDREISHVQFTHMVMQFGQLLDHELTHSPTSRGPNDEILNCTRCDSQRTISVHCMPIRVEHGDPHFPTNYPNGESRCLPFARSLLGQLTLGYRNQMNQITAYIDGSVIYGSTLCEADNSDYSVKG